MIKLQIGTRIMIMLCLAANMFSVFIFFAWIFQPLTSDFIQLYVDYMKNISITMQGKLRRDLSNSGEASITEGVSYGPVLQTSKNTVDLRGMRVEEASRHLKMAIGATESNSVIFIIHGMGTGVVKESALEILRNHPRVAKFEQESPMNYGCTVAYIK